MHILGLELSIALVAFGLSLCDWRLEMNMDHCKQACLTALRRFGLMEIDEGLPTCGHKKTMRGGSHGSLGHGDRTWDVSSMMKTRRQGRCRHILTKIGVAT